MGEVLPIEQQILATCNQCKNQTWILEVNAIGLNWKEVIGIECAECGNKVKIKEK